MAKIAALAPMQMASVSSTVAAKLRSFMNPRRANRMSWTI
jgi:hypothetical protein